MKKFFYNFINIINKNEYLYFRLLKLLYYIIEKNIYFQFYI